MYPSQSPCKPHRSDRSCLCRLGDLPAAVSKALYQHATQSPSDLASAAVATLHGLAAAKHDIEAEAEGAGEETLAGAGLKRLWHSWAPSDNDLMQVRALASLLLGLSMPTCQTAAT